MQPVLCCNVFRDEGRLQEGKVTGIVTLLLQDSLAHSENNKNHDIVFGLRLQTLMGFYYVQPQSAAQHV